MTAADSTAAGPAAPRDSKAARRRANRFRGFPLSWAVQPAPGREGCKGPTRRKRDQHIKPFLIATGRGAWGEGNSIVCANCCTFQQGKAIEWAESHDGYAESFR